MSLISLPSLRGTGAHRSKSPAQLRHELSEATCNLVALATEVDTLTAERDQLEAQLDAAGIELSGTRLELEQAQAEITALTARLANATRVTIPAATGDGQPTEPMPIGQRFEAGPVVTLPHKRD